MGQFVGSDPFSRPIHKSVELKRWGPCSWLQPFSLFYLLFFIHGHIFFFLKMLTRLLLPSLSTAENIFCLVGHFREYFRMLMPEDFRWDTGLFRTLKVVWAKLKHDESLLFRNEDFLGHTVCIHCTSCRKMIKDLLWVRLRVWSVFSVPCAPEVLLLPPAAPDPCLCWKKWKYFSKKRSEQS